MSADWQALPVGFFNHSCFIRWLLLPFCIFLWRRHRDTRQSISLRGDATVVSLYDSNFLVSKQQREFSLKNEVCSKEHVVCLVQMPNWWMKNGCLQIYWCLVSTLRVTDPNAWAMRTNLELITLYEFIPCAVTFDVWQHGSHIFRQGWSQAGVLYI